MQSRLIKSVAASAAGFVILLIAPPVGSNLAAQAGQTGAQAQQPVFRSEVERVRVDVQVVNSAKGDPVIGLGLDDFEVWLDGRQRRVASAELVSFDHEPLPADINDNTVRTPGRVPEDARVYVVAIDQMGLPVAAITPMKETI